MVVEFVDPNGFFTEPLSTCSNNWLAIDRTFDGSISFNREWLSIA
jgi:hypothetical protein